MKWKYIIGVFSCVILGAIFIFAGIGKLFAGLPSQTEFISQLTPIFAVNDTVARLISYVLPWIEIGIGMCLLFQLWANLIVIIICVPLIVGFCANNLWMLTNGSVYEHCNSCFGAFEKYVNLTPWQALAFDVGMLGLCCVIIFIWQYYPLMYGIFGRRDI